MSSNIGIGHIVVYQNTYRDYFLYEVIDVSDQVAQLKPINDGVEHSQSINKLRHAGAIEVKNGFRTLNPSNFGPNDVYYKVSL